MIPACFPSVLIGSKQKRASVCINKTTEKVSLKITGKILLFRMNLRNCDILSRLKNN